MNTDGSYECVCVNGTQKDGNGVECIPTDTSTYSTTVTVVMIDSLYVIIL